MLVSLWFAGREIDYCFIFLPVALRCSKAKPPKDKIAANALKERQYYLHDDLEEKVEKVKEQIAKVGCGDVRQALPVADWVMLQS